MTHTQKYSQDIKDSWFQKTWCFWSKVPLFLAMPCTHCPFLVLHSLPFSFKIWFVSGAGQLVIYVLVARGLPNADTHTHTRIPGTIGQRLTLPRARGLVPKSFSKLFARTQFCLKHNLSLVPSVLRSVFLHMSLKASLLRFWNILDLTWTTPGAGFCGEVHLWALE